MVSSGAPARSPAAPRAGLLAEGAQVLADFDFEAARQCFEAALSESEDDAAAVALLEVLLGKQEKGRAGQLLSIVREARTALAEKRGPAALKLLDVPLVWGAFEAQLGAQLAVAAHDSNVTESGGRMRARFSAAAFLEEADEKDRATLPLGEHALSPERLTEVAGLVRGWLDDILRPWASCRLSPAKR